MAKKYRKPTFYPSDFSLREKPVSEAYINRIADEIFKWAEECPDALIIADFLNQHRILQSNFTEWKRKFPQLKYANDFVKSMIAVRREKGMIHRDYDYKATSFMMPNYSKDWKEQFEYQNTVKNNTKQDSKIPDVIFLEKFKKIKPEEENE